MKSACLIGAGSSGIAVAKALHERGVPFDAFEASDRVGGNWVFGNKNGMSSAYKGLHINTSRARMEYSDFPMPPGTPHFPHHSTIAAYFEAYIDRFGLRDKIAFETRVARVEKRGPYAYEVALSTGETRRYDAVIVANGHHWDPLWPEPAFPGTLAGQVLHSHDYKEPAPFAGKRVVVLGMGNSAMDIAVELSHVADRVFLAARRGAHVVPKLLFGVPLDQVFTSTRVPRRLRLLLGGAALRAAVGDVTRYGLPKPDHALGEAHPTISSRILDRLAHGAVTPKPNLERLDGGEVVFVDGSRERVDAVIYATGYKVTFPFFDESFVSAKDNELPLYKRVFHPEHEGLAFAGLLQPLGAIMPLAEAQGLWLAEVLAGACALPDRRAMDAAIARERAQLRARYVRSKRHTMQVDFDEYLEDVHTEIARGRRRAGAAARG
ncbi:MAG TPA: NAD(P)-binding domain-containing protein [Polyangiaceae bacterium]|nr:NAD(P)-binding domain-containing protein [Polyangiaceae bacterium]